MLDSLNSIIKFLAMVLILLSPALVSFPVLTAFVIHTASELVLLVSTYIPPYMTVFGLLTVALSIALLIMGRSNNRG